MTSHCSQANRVVEKHDRGLGEPLWALLLDRSKRERDLLLPHIMKVYRGTPHSTTGETANTMML